MGDKLERYIKIDECRGLKVQLDYWESTGEPVIWLYWYENGAAASACTANPGQMAAALLEAGHQVIQAAMQNDLWSEREYVEAMSDLRIG